MKITVKSCEVKTQNEKFTVYKVTTDTGAKYESFEQLEVGKEYEGEVKESPPYAPQFKVKKDRKNYDFEKRRVALECATALLASGKIDINHLAETRDKFFNYLNQ